jgi:hypothetical protein
VPSPFPHFFDFLDYLRNQGPYENRRTQSLILASAKTATRHLTLAAILP